MYGLFNNIDYFAPPDCSLSSLAFDSDTKESTNPFISIIIDALHFDVPVFELKDLGAVLDLDFKIAFIREFGWWDFMGFQGENHSLVDEFGDFVFGKAFSEIGGIKKDLGLEFDLFDFGCQKFIILLFHQQPFLINKQLYYIRFLYSIY